MSFQFSFKVPSAVCSLAFISSESLCIGSDDGTARFYQFPSPKVVRAIRSLGSEISSIVYANGRKDEEPCIWLASGRRAFSFPVESEKIIMTSEDALTTLDLVEDDEDVLNELSLSENKGYLAFSTDSGTVGVIELSSKTISRMKTRHSNICGTVKFIPGRPNELISGGYDSALVHFDFAQGSVLSRYDIAAPPPSAGMSLSPPFILSISLTSTGLLAASTADGRIWLAGGGEKRTMSEPAAKKKRSRKWEGLREDEGLWAQVAEGPVVAVSFLPESSNFMTCTLLGKIMRYRIFRDSAGKLQTEETWSAETRHMEKVNAMVINERWMCMGGFDKDGKGVIEVWGVSDPEHI